MSRYLMVPVQLDGLYVAGEETTAVRQSPYFERQPYNETAMKQPFNSDIANVSESLLSVPFQSQTVRLSHGIHLHWAMPDALTRGDSQLNFPAVPERWLVTRKRLEQSTGLWKKDQQWVVESNYLYPPNVNKQAVAISIPYSSAQWRYNAQTGQFDYQVGDYDYRLVDIPVIISSNPEVFTQLFTKLNDTVVRLKLNADELASFLDAITGVDGINTIDIKALLSVLEKPIQRSSQPYRYMGRKMPVGAYQTNFPQAEYYQGLSAVGWGDPTFAAFYPNCSSVFGLHDPNPGDDLTQVRYEVCGWYGDESQDVLANFVGPASTVADILEQFNWQVEGDEVPQRLLCYAGIGFDSDFAASNAVANDQQVSITVANTPTEALSARLAKLLLEKKPELSESQVREYLICLEDQFEAMQQTFALDNKKLDTMARFRALRHANGFTPSESGHLWVIRKQSASNTEHSAENSGATVEDLPQAVAEQLDVLNIKQRAYDQALAEIESQRKQLFADWYKYMFSVYPHNVRLEDFPQPDLIKYFIEKQVLAPLNAQIERTGELEEPQVDEFEHIIALEVKEPQKQQTLAGELAQQWQLLSELINQATQVLNADSEDDDKVSFFTERIPAPRFWQPNNPVVLLHGDGIKPTQRHGYDGVLNCAVYDKGDDLPFGRSDFDALSQRVAELIELQPNINSRQPWHPFMLQWQAQLFNTLSHSNLHRDHGYYSEQFISDNYQANPLNPDLSLKPGKGKIAQGGDIYSGMSLLAPQADPLLKQAIEHQLIERLGIFNKAQDIAVHNYTGIQSFDNPVYSMICAYQKLQSGDSLSQALNGFNKGLLMCKQTMELNIDDPLGFAPYQHFTNTDIVNAMGLTNIHAPSPLNAFNPIRSGCLKLLKFRLVDTFGQVKTLDVNNIGTTYKMTTQDSRYLIKLPPRLAQPARLNFRWLDSNKTHAETNAHVATSPICGWLVNNIHDSSLMVFDAKGHALGYFKARKWYQAIDSDRAMDIDDIENPHLRRVAKFIFYSLTLDGNFLQHFIGTTEDALDNIQVEKDPKVNGPAMLFGRPMAVVRATLDLQLSGKPAINQGWNVFRTDINKHQRTIDEFTCVQFPVRLGEYGQLNDGLVGYWLEKTSANGDISFASERLNQQGKVEQGNHPLFYAPQSQYIDSNTIESKFEHLEDGPINFYQSIKDAAQCVTMLLDVQGSIHASVGILPHREISIDAEHYTQALQNIEVSFLHAPIITPSGRINTALQPINGLEWSWVEQQQNHDGLIVWDERFVEKRVQREAFIEVYQALTGEQSSQTDAIALWQYLLGLDVAWLAEVDDNRDGLVDDEQAKLVAIDDRVIQQGQGFTAGFAGRELLAEQILKHVARGIEPTQIAANFIDTQEIREGWLKLRRR